MLPGGDGCEIGERGITLSGGQKARVALARACYRPDCTIYILDDVLAAVDAGVRAHIINECLINLLLKERGGTVILATHHVASMPRVDLLVKLSTEGTIDSITDTPHISGRGGSGGGMDDGANEDALAPTAAEVAAEKVVQDEKEKEGKLTEAEVRKVGRVEMEAVKKYLWAGMGSYWFLFLIAFIYVFASSVSFYQPIFLAAWVADLYAQPLHFYQIGYAVINLIGVIGIFLRFILVTGVLCIRASRKLHQRMLSAVLNSPLSFFDTTPIGRVINRFTADMMVLDDGLPLTLALFVFMFVTIFTTFAMMSTGVPYLAALIPLLLVIGWRVVRRYRPTARETERLLAVAKSPIYASCAEALNGLATIRAFKAEARLLDHHRELLVVATKVGRAKILAQMWFILRLTLVNAVLLCFTAAAVFVEAILRGNVSDDDGAVLLNATDGPTTASRDAVFNAGLDANSLIIGASIAPLYTGVLSLFSTLESMFTNAERVLSYADLPSEVTESPKDPPKEWPDGGRIELKSIVFSYRPGLPIVLNKLELTIAHGRRLGSSEGRALASRQYSLAYGVHLSYQAAVY